MSHTSNKWISSLDMHSGGDFPNVNGWESFSPGVKLNGWAKYKMVLVQIPSDKRNVMWYFPQKNWVSNLFNQLDWSYQKYPPIPAQNLCSLWPRKKQMHCRF